MAASTLRDRVLAAISAPEAVSVSSPTPRLIPSPVPMASSPATLQATHQWQLPDVAYGESPGPMLVTSEQAVAPLVPAGEVVLQSQS